MSRRGRIDSGRRDRRYVVEKAVVTRGADGSESKAWTEHAVVWGAYKEMKGDEPGYARQLMALATATVTIPWKSTITTAMRLKSGDRIWHIENVNEDDRWENEMVLTVYEMTES